MSTTDRTAAPPIPEPPRGHRLAWSEARALMRSDFARLVARMGMTPTLPRRSLWFALPSYQALLWYRVSRYCYLRGWRTLAASLHLVSQYVTHVDIPPATSIGRGCLLGHPPMVLCGRIGENFSMNGHGGIGGGFDSRDIGAGPGLPVVGNNVTMAIRATVLGPVHIGDGARLGPACTVMRDVPAGSIVAAPLSRVMRSDADTTTVEAARNTP